MRHDAHYVEELVSDARAKALANTTRRSHERAEDPMREPGAALPMARACVEIGRSLDAVGACLHLFRDGTRPAAEQVALDLIGVEVACATWLVQALSVLDEDPPVANAPVEIGSVARRVVRALTPGHRRAAASLEVDEGAPVLRVRGDEQLLTVAVAGMVMALQAVVQQVETAVVRVRIHRDETTGRVRVETSQDALRVPASWRARFFDPQWADLPGGRRIAVALAASRRIAALHHGTLTMEDAEQGGSRLVLSLPAA